MAAPTPVAPPTEQPPLVKFKWLIPFTPWLSIGIATLKHPTYWPSLEGRILHVVGVAAVTVALLAVIQSWRRDDERASTGRLDRGLRREPDRIDDRGQR
jgi:hypothetical protein